MVAVRLLQKIGYQHIKTVTNGKEAIKVLESERHDVIEKFESCD